MSFQDETGSDSDNDEMEDCISGLNKGDDNSDIEVDDTVEDPAFSEKDTFDHSSDDFNNTDVFGQVYGQKRYKKGDKQSKSKVKIKTLTIDGQLVYFCKICDKIFTRRKDKLNHELAHSGESVLTCTECGKEYLHESSLASHMRTHAGDPLYMCDLCPKMFAQSHHLKAHILSHSEPTNFVCKTCYSEFPTSSDLNHHIRIQSKLEMTKYWCKMCKVYFCRNHSLICDTRLHAFCCSACSELFYTHKKLKIHMKKFAHYSLDKPKYIEPLQEHELYPDKVQESLKKLQAQKENDLVRKPLKNDLNGKRHTEYDTEVPLKKFKLSIRQLTLDGDQSSTSLQDSAVEASKEFQIDLKSPTKHRKGKPYCKKCNKSFKDSIDLDHHKAVVHEDKQDSFSCKICGLGFSSKGVLEKHGFKHSEEHVHTCPVCGQEFRNSLQLTKHLRIHVNDFPYKCSQCGKAFRLKIQLIQHVRLHIAQDTNTCENGPRSFIVGEESQEHCHGEADTFKCHLCSKKFSFRYKLLNHLRLHTNVKCFQCYVCHKAFATKCYLQRHLQVHVKQGIDVDVQNIIIDEDSKFELDNVKEQITRDNFQNIESICNHHSFDSFEREDLKKPMFGIKRPVSNFGLESRVNNLCSTSFKKNCKENDKQNLSIDSGDIKLEVQEDMDSYSEHSFCSSFTRDSERSDPFKFSSDESYTFKTAMAKERRRLKRRWRKNRSLFMKSDAPAITDLRKVDLNSEPVCSEAGNGHEEDITDMVVELNAVRSEHDDTTTVFVNLTQKKSASFSKSFTSCVTETESSLKDSSSLLKFELNVKDEFEQKCENNDLKPAEGSHNENVDANNTSLSVNSGKMLMFEFDVERLFDSDIKLLNDGGKDRSSKKYNDEKRVTEEQKGEAKTEMDKNRIELVQNRSEDNISSSKSLLPSNKNSHMRFITPDSNVLSEASNLEKLQAVFEHSSKYLPLPQTSSNEPCPSVGQSEPQIKPTSSTKQNEAASSTEYNSHDMDSSCNSYLQDTNLISVSQETGDGKIRALPPLSVQNSVFTDSKQQTQSKAADCKLPHTMNYSLDTRSTSHMIVNITDKSSRCRSATSEATSSNKCDKNIPAQRTPIKQSTDNKINFHVGNPITSSQIFPNTSICNVSTSLMPQTCSTMRATNATPQPSSHSSSSLTVPPPTLVNSTLSYYPVIGNSGSDLGYLHSELNLQPSSLVSMNLNPFFGSLGTRDFNAESIAVSSSYNTNQTNTTGPFGSCLISSNPLVNPHCAIGLNTSANQNFQLAVNQDCFSLNPSTIFDASNPIYRDMNMMDLINTPSAECSQTIAASNPDFMRQGNLETQMRHSITSHVEAQNAIFQLQNPFLNLGNPSLSANFGNVGNPLCNLINQGVIPVNFGHLDNPVLNFGPVGVRAGEDFPMNARNIYGPVCRDDGTLGNSGNPQFSIHMGNFDGHVPLNVASIFPQNTSCIGNFGSLRPGSFNTPVSGSIADLGGSSLVTGSQPFNQAYFHYDFPLSIPTNSHVINNQSSSIGAFSTIGLQDNLSNLIASSNVNLLNSAVLPQNTGTLPRPSLGFINNVNTGFFPQF